MTIEWSKTKLGKVITLEYGKPLPRDKRGIHGKYPVFGANGEIDRTDEFLYDQLSIIVGRKGSAGEINLTAEKFWPLDVTYYIKFDREQYDLFFLYYLLCNLQLPKLAKGVKPGINRNEVYSIEVNIPPLPEQQRIVEILDQSFISIDQAIANTEKILQNSKEIFESYLHSLLCKPHTDWERTKLGSIISLEYGKPLAQGDRKTNGKFAVYGANGIINRTDKYYYAKESIIIGRKGSAGELNITEKCFWPLDVTYFVKFDNLYFDLYFLYYLLFTLDLPRLAKGVKPGINRNEVYDIDISFPNLETQKQISKKILNLSINIDMATNRYKNKLQLLSELKQSILQKAFTGELT